MCEAVLRCVHQNAERSQYYDTESLGLLAGVSVILSGGLPAAVAPADVDPVVFAPRVSIPLLMLNGEQDFIYNLESQQNPLFNILGSPPGQKKHIVFPGGHTAIFDSRTRVIAEMLDWFDRYLGPVQ